MSPTPFEKGAFAFIAGKKRELSSFFLSQYTSAKDHAQWFAGWDSAKVHAHPQTIWRRDANISQAKLADFSGIDQGQLSKIEVWEQMPSVNIAIKLCIAQAELSSIVPPLRVTQYGSRQLALTYRNTMEAHHHGMAKGEAAGTTAEEIGDDSKRRYAAKTAKEAVSAAHQRTRTRRSGGRKRKAAKTAKAKKQSIRY